ncbi:MAG: hypothetical protein IPK07_16325 [Deltaproteobacteria bacterium]|nr:hypothetical protein [Deltaproteobacteria bacterium]
MKSRALTAGLLAAIMLAGGWLRFDRIRETSPFLWDDAIHHLEAVWLGDALHFLRTSVELKRAEARGGGDLWTWEGERHRFHQTVGGIPPRFGRPGHMVLVTAAMAAVGPVPWAGPLVAASCGTLSIAALFALVLGARRNDREAPVIALLAAAFLAFDPLSVRLSREGLADADGAFFALLAIGAYVRARRPGMGLAPTALAGLLAGFSFTVQTRNFLVVAMLAGWELAPGALSAGRRVGERTRRAATLLACAALFPVLCELPYYGALLIGRAHGIAPQVRSYVLQVIGIFANHHYAKRDYVQASGLANLASYPSLFHSLAGSWLPQLVALGGLAVVQRQALARHGEERAARLVPLTWLIGTFLFLSVTAPLGRYASLFVPALAWVSAEGLAAALRRARVRGPTPSGDGHGHSPAQRLFSRRLAATWLVAGTIALGIQARAGALESGVAEPGYAAAVAWMRAHGGPRHVTTTPYVSQVWAGVGEAEFLPGTESELAKLVESGHRHLLVDLIRNFFLGPFSAKGEVLKQVAARCPLAATFPNTWAERPEYLFEFNYDVRETWHRIESAHADRSGEIEIYDLAACSPPFAATSPELPAEP